ncbi:MAG: LysM peptidoglycan-binding domain-containing protein, partial [Chloroflexi bacterium]|nr:LysM peptidoglycan-binding domain-containing protein [Chloroflexota bacterium]
MKVRLMFVCILFGLSLMAAGCGEDKDRPAPASPTPPTESLPSPTVIAAAPTQTPGGPTLTPSPTTPPTITPTVSPPPPPPSETPTATPLPGPYEHTIQSGDSCLAIAMKYGHLDPAVKDAIEALNGMADCSILPGPGSVILIPRPTATFTPVGADLTQTVIATSAPP